MNEDSLKHIDRLIAQRPISKTALVPFRDLAALMLDIEPKPTSLPGQDVPWEMKQREGFPLFSRQDLPIDYEAAEILLKRFLRTLATADREDREGIQKASQRAETGPQWTQDLYRAVLGEDSGKLKRMAKEVDLNPAVLKFLAEVSLRPSLQTLRDALVEQMEKAGWTHGICPVCGSQPDMAYLAGTGKRFLHCGLCGEEWPYPRIQCPFCQNQGQKTLGLLEVEGEEGLKVHFCRKCLRYLKTIDARVFEEMAPLDIENLATLHLDILANQQGFK